MNKTLDDHSELRYGNVELRGPTALSMWICLAEDFPVAFSVWYYVQSNDLLREINGKVILKISATKLAVLGTNTSENLPPFSSRLTRLAIPNGL
jgi:hypothetical protein